MTKTHSNQTLQATAGKRLGWQVGCQRPAVPDLDRSPMNPYRHMCALVVGVLLTLCRDVPAADQEYFDRFLSVTSSWHGGFVTDSSLVDTNSSFPIPTDGTVSLSELRHRGELCGVRLGMSMNEVVHKWGKPNMLYPYCLIGPRLWYTGSGSDLSSGVTLFFASNRLQVIILSGKRLNDMRFEEGLSGIMEEQAIRAALGPPLEHPPKGRLAGDSMVYCEENIRTDFVFSYSSPRPKGLKNSLARLRVQFTDDATSSREGEPNGPVNRSQPIQHGTNSTPLPAGSGR